MHRSHISLDVAWLHISMDSTLACALAAPHDSAQFSNSGAVDSRGSAECSAPDLGLGPGVLPIVPDACDPAESHSCVLGRKKDIVDTVDGGESYYVSEDCKHCASVADVSFPGALEGGCGLGAVEDCGYCTADEESELSPAPIQGHFQLAYACDADVAQSRCSLALSGEELSEFEPADPPSCTAYIQDEENEAAGHQVTQLSIPSLLPFRHQTRHASFHSSLEPVGSVKSTPQLSVSSPAASPRSAYMSPLLQSPQSVYATPLLSQPCVPHPSPITPAAVPLAKESGTHVLPQVFEGAVGLGFQCYTSDLERHDYEYALRREQVLARATAHRLAEAQLLASQQLARHWEAWGGDFMDAGVPLASSPMQSPRMHAPLPTTPACHSPPLGAEGVRGTPETHSLFFPSGSSFGHALGLRDSSPASAPVESAEGTSRYRPHPLGLQCCDATVASASPATAACGQQDSANWTPERRVSTPPPLGSVGDVRGRAAELRRLGRVRSMSKIPLHMLHAIMGISDQYIGKHHEDYIMWLLRQEGFHVGFQTWIRDTPEATRADIIERIYSKVARLGYNRDIIELVIRRGTYVRMQGKLRRLRRFQRSHGVSEDKEYQTQGVSPSSQ